MIESRSVHLTSFPDVSEIDEGIDLVTKMDQVRDICNIALSIRKMNEIRTRIPLNEITVYGNGSADLISYGDIIKDELNVKKVNFFEEISLDVAEWQLNINFRVCGKRLGGKVQEIIKLAKEGNFTKLDDGLILIAGIILEKDEFSLSLVTHNSKSTKPTSDNKKIVYLDLNITPELELEGVARDVVRLIQQSRKELGYHIADKISANINTDSAQIKESVDRFATYIKEQTLSDSLLCIIGNDIKNSHKTDYGEIELCIRKL